MKQKGTVCMQIFNRQTFMFLCIYPTCEKIKVAVATLKSVMLIAMASQCQTRDERSHIIFALKRKTTDWLKMSTKRLRYVKIQGQCHCRH